MKKFFRCSLKKRIIVTAACISFATVILLSAISLSYFQAYARKNVIQSSEFNLRLVAGLIEQDLTAIDTLSKWCFINEQFIDYLEDSSGNPKLALNAYKILSDEYYDNRSYSYIQRLIITDINRTKILQVGNLSSNGPPVTVYNIDKIIDFSLKKPLIWPDIKKDLLSSSISLSLTRPIKNLNTGKLLGYVYLSVNPSVITDRLKDYQTKPGNYLYIAINKNTYKIEKGGFVPSKLNIEFSETLQKNALSGDTQVGLEALATGKTQIIVSHPIASTGLKLFQSLSEELITEQQNLYLRLLFLLAGGIILLAAILSLSLTQMINNPISLLRQKIDKIGHGDFSLDPNIEWDNEFGYIGHGINKLAQNVQILMESRLADEKQKRNLEYQMLQSQINPHFLYNTLGSIKWMAHIQGADGIEQMAISLSRLLKNIAKGTKELISLEDELSLLNDYFIIQKYRYGGLITMEIDIPENLKNNCIPRFTLQPLVENANS